MFIEIGNNVVDINEICAVTKVDVINLLRSIKYEFQIIFKSGAVVTISNIDKLTLEQIHNELVVTLKKRGGKMSKYTAIIFKDFEGETRYCNCETVGRRFGGYLNYFNCGILL